jgi:long-chain fatty acid transport protein
VKGAGRWRKARWRKALTRIVVLCAATLVPAEVSAQTSLQIPLQFDFLNPGAKSLALGGAFAGLADDATAAFANPGGLTQLDTSELSVEGRRSRVTTQFLEAGRLSGATSNMGTDTIQGAMFGDTAGSHFGAGFLAAVYAHPSHRWVIAAYRHELVHVNQTFLSRGVFQQDPAQPTSQRDPPQQGMRQVTITGYGVSGSYKLRQTVAVGASMTAYTFDLASVFRRFDTVGFFGPPVLNVEVGRAAQSGNNVSWAPSVGVVLGRDERRFGIVYRQGPSFDMITADAISAGRPGVFRVPNTLAFGASARLTPPLTVAVELTRVWYSRLREDFVTDQALSSGHQAGFRIDNGTEIHGGIQYAVRRWRTVPRLRVGAWFDPDHSVHFTPEATAPDRLFDERLSTALSTGKNQVHLTGGIGLTLGSHLEFNAALDAASTTRIFSSSLIVR